MGLVVGTATVGAALPLLTAPPAAATHLPLDPVAVALADALTTTTDASQPVVQIVDPGRWQTVANAVAAGILIARDRGALTPTVGTLQSLAGCAAMWNARNDTTGLQFACPNEWAALGSTTTALLLAALAVDEDSSPAPGETRPPANPAPDPEAGTGDSWEPSTPAETQTGEREADPDGDGPQTRAAQPAPAPPPGDRSRPRVGRFVAPTAGVITSTFQDGRNHGGIDIANTKGAPIVAVADGEVISAGPAPGYGLWVRIRHEDGTVSIYGHNNDNLVSVGQRVRAGQKIATVGNRGNSTGPHLHFEVETPSGTTTDPVRWLAARGVSIVEVD